AFVSLSQSALMDSATDRQAQRMARWTLAGSAGAVAGPLLVAAVLAAGASWRLAFMACAACSVMAWLAVAATGRTDPEDGSAAAGPGPGTAPPRAGDRVPADDESGWPRWAPALPTRPPPPPLRGPPPPPGADP